MYITEDNYLNTSLAGMMRLHKAWILVGEVHVLFDIDFYDSGLYSLGAVRYMHISGREQWAVDVGVFQPSEYLGISSDISVLPWLGINRYF